jgi:hypothetical protein
MAQPKIIRVLTPAEIRIIRVLTAIPGPQGPPGDPNQLVHFTDDPAYAAYYLYDRVRDAINVRGLGIPSDGTSDLNAAGGLQICYDAAIINGCRRVFYERTLRDGGWAFGSQIKVDSGVESFGVGRKTSWIRPLNSIGPSVAAFRNKNVSTTDGSRLDSDIQFHDLGFDCADRIVHHWLTDPTNEFAPITDPQNDYYNAATNPTGLIQNPATPEDTDGIALAQAPASGVDFVLNGAIGTAPFGSPRKVVWTYPENNKDLVLTAEGTLDGVFKTSSRTVLKDSNTRIATNDLFDKVSRIYVTGTIVGTVTTGFLMYDIYGLLHDHPNRRNTGYGDINTIVAFTKVNNPLVHDCYFVNQAAWCISDAGCLAGRYLDIMAENGGRPDQISPVIWVNSYGNPFLDPLPASFAFSVNPTIERLVTRNYQRIPITFNCHGGKIISCDLQDSGEGAIFATAAANIDNPGDNLGGISGAIEIAHNFIKGVTKTDISGDALALGSDNVWVHHNTFQDVEGRSYVYDGRQNKFSNNLHKNTPRSFQIVYPYGPESERYRYAVTTPPIGGTTLTINSIVEQITKPIPDPRPPILETPDETIIENEIVTEDRTLTPTELFFISWNRGQTFQDTKGFYMRGVDLRYAAPFMELYDAEAADTNFDKNQPFRVENCSLSPSSGAVIKTRDFAANETGQFAWSDFAGTGTGISPIGFRPRAVHLMLRGPQNLAAQLAHSWIVDEAARNPGDTGAGNTSEQGFASRAYVTGGVTYTGSSTNTSTCNLTDLTTGTVVVAVVSAGLRPDGIVLQVVTNTVGFHLQITCFP